MLQIKGISKQYRTGELVQQALNDVSLNLRDNEFVSILGPSGSGKTTLLNVIGGLDRYDTGELVINGISTREYKDRDWDVYRNHTIGFVFQSYNLIPGLNVWENIVLPLGLDKLKADPEETEQLLSTLGIYEKRYALPSQLSGGQQQRVAIARALATKPHIVLADEPTGNLDSKTSLEVMLLLEKLNREFSQTILMITHNEELAQMTSRRIRIEDGRIVSDSGEVAG